MPEPKKPASRKLNLSRTVQLNKDEMDRIAKSVQRGQTDRTQELMRQQELLKKGADGTASSAPQTRHSRSSRKTSPQPKHTAGQTTLSIPKLNQEMVEVAKRMKDQGASNEEILQTLNDMRRRDLMAREKAEREEAERYRNAQAQAQSLNPARSSADRILSSSRRDRRNTLPQSTQAQSGQGTASQNPAAEKAAGTVQFAPAQGEESAAKTQAFSVRKAAPRPAAVPERKNILKKTLKEANEELTQTIRDDHIWLNNPAMVRGQFLAPLVVAASTASNALMLCAATALLLTGTRVLAALIHRLTGGRGRSFTYVFSAAVLYIPAYIILYAIFGADLTALGVYLPMLVMEPALIKRMEYDDIENVSEAVSRGISNTVGITIAAMGVGILRELIGSGTLFGEPVFSTSLLPVISQPAGGFLLAGVLAAVWTAITNTYIGYKREEVRVFYGRHK